MGAAADQVGAGTKGVAEERPLVGAGGPGDRPRAEGDDLHVDDIGDATADFRQRLDAAQSVLQCRVGVRAHGAEAVARHQPGGSLGALDDVVDVEQRLGSKHRLDRAEEVAGRVGHALGEEGLVEVGVRLDGCGQQEVTGEIVLDVIRTLPDVADSVDPAVAEPDVSRRAVGERHSPQHFIGHPGDGTLGPCDHR